jgi:hypothetical protein
METPLIPPVPKPPLGARFYVLLFLPIALMALTFSLQSTSFVNFLFAALALTTLVCSVLLAIQLGHRLAKSGSSPTLLAFLMFFALQAFYFICFFVGCTATLLVA